MPDIGTYYKKPHITAYDFGGKSWNLTIKGIFMKKVWDAQKMAKVEKPCLRFEEAQKYFIMGEKTAQAIARVLGSRNTDEWVGQQICLFTEKKPHSKTGEIIEVIRVSDKLAEKKTPEPPPGIQPPAPEAPAESEEELRERLSREATEKNAADKQTVNKNDW